MRTQMSHLTALVCLVLMAAVPLHARAEATDPLTLVPDNAIGCLRINNLNQSLASMDQYLIGASPIPMSMAMLVNMQLAGIVGDPMLTGIDKNGNFCFFAVAAEAPDAPPVMGLLVPVTSYKDFVSKNPNCTALDDQTTILAAPNSAMGALLLSPTPSDTFALVVPESEKDTLPTLKGMISAASSAPLSKRLQGAVAKESAAAPAWLYVNLADLYAKYNEQVLGMIQMGQGQMAAAGGPAEMMQFQFKMLTEMFRQFGGEADSVTLSLTPTANLLTLDLSLQAKSGSELAKMFSARTSAAPYTLTGYFDDKNAVNGLMKADSAFVLKYNEKFLEIFQAVSDDPAFKEKTEKMKTLSQKALASMGDEVAFSFSYAAGMPPFKLQEVLEVKDPAALTELIEEGLDYANSIYKTMGLQAELKYQAGVSTYKNATIDIVSISITAPDDPNDPVQQGIQQMYGEGFKYYLARTADKFFITMGAEGEDTLKALIDRPAAAVPSGDIKIAMDTLAGTPYTDAISSVNIIKLLQGMGDMMKSIGGGSQTGPAAIFSSIKDIPTQSCMVVGSSVADERASMRLAMPKQHLAEIVGMAMQIQMQMAQPQAQVQMPDVNAAPPAAALQTPMETPSEVDLTSWIGKPAPELKVKDLEGNIYRISRLKGKKVLLDFWATWCPPCKETIPDLIKLKTDSKESELVVLGLSDEPADLLAKYSKNAKMNYPVIAAGEEMPAPYGQVTALPTLFVIDSNGLIQDILVGYHPLDELKARLNKLN